MAKVNKITEYNEYNITNAHIRFKKGGELQAAEKMGCTGKLALETELREISKTCEGAVVQKWVKVVQANGTFTGHVRVDVLRKIFGLTNDNLKQGVYGYGETSVNGSGALTFMSTDVTREIEKLIGFPNISFTEGLKFELENGKEEIAEIELAFTAMLDDNKNVYYEAFVDELAEKDKEDIKAKWFTEFNPELVLAADTKKKTQESAVSPQV